MVTSCKEVLDYKDNIKTHLLKKWVIEEEADVISWSKAKERYYDESN